MYALLLLFQSQGFFTQLGNRIQEGGPVAMSTILICLLIIIGLIAFSAIKLSQDHLFKKAISLIHHISLFALVVGLLSQFLGLIQVFDAIESFDNIPPQLIGGGIKLTLLGIVFGTFTFLIGRLGIIILTAIKK